jgi:class 3 adenylate cyclase
MQAVIKALQEKWSKRLSIDLSIRIGINTGGCTAGVFGSDSLRSYTVIGSPVNLASRLTAAAPPDGIACCYNSLKWVKLRSRYRSIGEVSLKGIREPVEVFQILAVVEPDLI